MNQIPITTAQGGTDGPDAHAYTDHAMSVADSDPALDPAALQQPATDVQPTTQHALAHLQPAAEQSQPHAHRTADRDAALDPAEPQPHPDAHSAADRQPAVVPGQQQRAADGGAAELSAERLGDLYESIRRSALGVRDAFSALNVALLDGLIALHRLTHELGDLSDLHPWPEPGAGGDSGERDQPTGEHRKPGGS